MEKAKRVKKVKVIRYKFNPKALAASIARKAKENSQELVRINKEREVAKLAKKGVTFEEMGEKLGISTNEAFAMTKAIIARWATEIALDATEAKELQIKQHDALLVILWKEVEPYVLRDDKGKVILDGNTGMPALSTPNMMAAKLIIEILDRKAKLLGLEAASKMEVKAQIETIERRYIGADPANL